LNLDKNKTFKYIEEKTMITINVAADHQKDEEGKMSGCSDEC
jgi:hypothetical protein